MQMQSTALEFDDIARNIFYPIYSVIADQILDGAKVNPTGICLDVGCGSGYLGLAIAKKTNMTLCCYDLSTEALEITKDNIIEEHLQKQAYTCLGNVEAIPYPDSTFDLVVSRGSLFFWENKAKAINEINRVLKPGGWAYLGGGFGNQKLKHRIDQQMLQIDDQWLIKAAKRKGSSEAYKNLMLLTQVNTYQIREDETGLWIIFEKN
jgi:ubiquinone/menaquinone biosynthesis C-methylase UbiE